MLLLLRVLLILSLLLLLLAVGTAAVEVVLMIGVMTMFALLQPLVIQLPPIVCGVDDELQNVLLKKV